MAAQWRCTWLPMSPGGGGQEVNAARPANTASTLQPMDPGAVVIFGSYYLRRTFRKATAAMDMIPHGSEQSYLLERSHHSGCHYEHSRLMGRGQNMSRSLKKWI